MIYQGDKKKTFSTLYTSGVTFQKKYMTTESLMRKINGL